MASIFKRTRSYPIPKGAEVIERRRKATSAELRQDPQRRTIIERFAKWTDSKTGRTRKAPIIAKKRGRELVDLVVIEAKTYTIAYFDASGKRQEMNTETPDLQTAERIAGRIEDDLAQRKKGLIDATQERLAKEARRVIDEHLADFKAAMQSAARSAEHIDATIGFVEAIADAAGWQNLADIGADAVNTYASDLLKEGLAARTVEAKLTAVKSFTRWLVKHGKLSADPLASVKKPSPAKDRRHERRMLLPEEWEWLRVTTAAGPDRYGMTGQERILLYAVAIQTGLRSNECRSLTRGRLFLDAAQPYIVCKARTTKNAKDCKQYIQPDLAAELAGHIATKTPAAPVFNMPPAWDVAPMFRDDLADARAKWLEATNDPKERIRRTQSDFLAYENHEKEKADFHALRHTTGAWLAMAGLHPNVVKTVMRHCTIKLTMDTYGHLFPGQDAGAVAALPSMMARATDAPEALQATGTDGDGGRNCQHIASSGGAKSGQEMANSGERHEDCREDDDAPQVVSLSGLGETGRDGAKVRLRGLEPRTHGLKVRCSTD